MSSNPFEARELEKKRRPAQETTSLPNNNKTPKTPTINEPPSILPKKSASRSIKKTMLAVTPEQHETKSVHIGILIKQSLSDKIDAAFVGSGFRSKNAFITALLERELPE